MKGRHLPFLILGAQVLVVLIQIFLYVPQFSAGLVTTQGCLGCPEDAIQVAAQLGRLDIVTLVLAMFGIILAVVAFWGFFSIKGQSEAIAHKVASDEAIRIASQRLDWFESAYLKPRLVPERSASVADIETQGSEKMGGDGDDEQT